VRGTIENRPQLPSVNAAMQLYHDATDEDPRQRWIPRAPVPPVPSAALAAAAGMRDEEARNQFLREARRRRQLQLQAEAARRPLPPPAAVPHSAMFGAAEGRGYVGGGAPAPAMGAGVVLPPIGGGGKLAGGGGERERERLFGQPLHPSHVQEILRSEEDARLSVEANLARLRNDRQGRIERYRLEQSKERERTRCPPPLHTSARANTRASKQPMHSPTPLAHARTNSLALNPVHGHGVWYAFTIEPCRACSLKAESPAMAALRQRLKRIEAAQRETPRGGNAAENAEAPPPGRADAPAVKGRDRADQERLAQPGASGAHSARGSSAAEKARRDEVRVVKERAREEANATSADVEQFETRIKQLERTLSVACQRVGAGSSRRGRCTRHCPGPILSANRSHCSRASASVALPCEAPIDSAHCRHG
jgi:hypothetical protein